MQTDKKRKYFHNKYIDEKYKNNQMQILEYKVQIQKLNWMKKKSLNETLSRLETSEEKVSELENIQVEITHWEQ